MSVVTFEMFWEQIQTLFAQAAYAEAFAQLTQGLDHYPDETRHLDYYRLCAAARLDKRDFVYTTLKRQLAEGFWYTEVLLRQTPSFQPLQGEPEFEALIQENITFQEREMNAGGAHVIVPPESTAAWPTLIALHGNSGSAQAETAAWKPIVEQGWQLAMPESTQVGLWKGSYNWDDEASTFKTITEFYNDLSTDDVVLLGGFSMGGRMALRAALGGLLPVQGFIVLTPYIFDSLDDWQPLIAQGATLGLRGYIMVNEGDMNYENIRAFNTALNVQGIPCGFETFPGEHIYPPGFAQGLLHALEFVQNY